MQDLTPTLGVFAYAEHADLMVPVKAGFSVEPSGPPALPGYPRFQSLVYSLDVFLPIVDLHQESFWLPDGRNASGRAVLVYLWFQILVGWVLTSVAVAGLTGLVRKD